MTALPAWANTPIGRALVQAILADPPESRQVRDDWGTRDWRSYAGKVAGTLRRLHDEWQTRELAKLDRTFAITGVWDDAASRAVLGCEDSNQLIERLLAEAGSAREAA